jgi:nicotinate-nucleotide adenylyltransferase
VLGAAYALAVAPIDRLLVVPCSAHALGKGLGDFEHRLAMCRLAFRDLARTEVSDLEGRLGTPSFTLRTLQALADMHPDWSLRLVIGSDILCQADRWYRWPEVLRMAPPFVIGRPGWDGPHVPPAFMPEMSSTDVRRRLARGERVSDLVPSAVEAYIRERGLYGAG